MSTTSPALTRTGPSWRVWSLRVAPYVVTAAVVTAILRRYSLGQIAAEMRVGHALRMLPFGLGMPFLVWTQYAACDRFILGATVGPVALRDVMRAKAASAVLLTLGYFFGGGGYAVWIARTTRAGAARAAGAVLYAMASDLMAVCAVGGAAMWLGGAEVSPSLRAVATWVFGIQIGFVVFGPYGGWLRLPQVFAPWRLVPRRGSLVQIGVRAVNISIITGCTWGAMRAFGVPVPARTAAMYLPIILLVTSLPINVAGLGVAQAAWLLLLPWAPGPQLLAFQVLWHVSTGLGILLRGLPFLRSVVREIEVGAGPSPAD